MKERGEDDGYILIANRYATAYTFDNDVHAFVHSISGHRIYSSPTENTLFYSVTKHAVTALIEGIRRELVAMKSNIRVTVSI